MEKSRHQTKTWDIPKYSCLAKEKEQLRLRRSQGKDITEAKRGMCFNQEEVVNSAKCYCEVSWRKYRGCLWIWQYGGPSDLILNVNEAVDQKVESNGRRVIGTFQFNEVDRTHAFTSICFLNYNRMTAKKFKGSKVNKYTLWLN